jgi:hypothetical protein
MTEPSRLYMLIERRLRGTLDDFVASRRATCSWTSMAAEIKTLTGIEVSDETLRRWFASRIEVKIRPSNPASAPAGAV